MGKPVQPSPVQFRSSRPFRRHYRNQHHLGAGDGAEESRENKVMNFARYMMKQGAQPINGTNEGTF